MVCNAPGTRQVCSEYGQSGQSVPTLPIPFNTPPRCQGRHPAPICDRGGGGCPMGLNDVEPSQPHEKEY